jgi:MoaA/NifB/PqqE/SkfB family radical SAM enzyme
MAVSFDVMHLAMPHQPGILVVHLLNQCNLSCKHCYMDATKKTDKLLPREMVLKILSEVEQLGIGTVYLSGGEPFLYPWLSGVLRFASKQHGFSTIVSTNGTLISQADIDLLKDCGVGVNVSIDGPADYHDQFRGSKGAFLRTSRNIVSMLDAGISVSLIMTICQDNLTYLPWLAEWASGIGVKNVSIQPLTQLGRASKIQDKKLSENQMCSMFFQLSDLGYIYRLKGVNFTLNYRSRDFLLEHPCAAHVCNGSKCHRKVEKEIKKLIIREDGTVLPEIATLNPRFSLGNVRDGTLTDLVKNYFESNYSDFDHLCRSVYAEVLPNWTCPMIPWNEILSEKSWDLSDRAI